MQLPWLETPVIYDVRAKPRNIASLTGTKDLQMVRIMRAFGIRHGLQGSWFAGEHHMSSAVSTIY